MVPVSTSVAAAVPKEVLLAADSDTLKLCAPVITGALSFTSLTAMLKTALLKLPSSEVATTVMLCEVLVS